MVAHLMRRKKDTAIGQKYQQGDAITNMEGALHTFVTPVCSIEMTGDYVWRGRHSAHEFEHGQKRRVVMSAAVQPDFENTEVMLQVLALDSQRCVGENFKLGRCIRSACQQGY